MSEGDRDVKVHGHLVTGPEFAPVCYAIGNFILGCSVIELQTYLWIEGFSPADRDVWRTTKKGFGDRKRRVLEIVDAMPLDQIYKTGSGDIWADAAKVMQFRNVVAHNPILFRYDGPESNVADSMRIPSIKEWANGDFPDFTLADLDEQAKQAADVNERLENYRHVIADALGIRIDIAYRYGST